jgi:hypothetical protein
MDARAAQLGEEAARRLRHLMPQAIQSGLTEAECARVEGRFRFEFADDHRAFLLAGLPAGRRWPDWRGGDHEHLTAWLARPVDGVLFDVHHNTFWDRSWGKRPTDAEEALRVARRELARVPQMVPVYGHRYLPPGRGSFGHPVLSMHQTDIVSYGDTIVEYITNEFGGQAPNLRSDRSAPRPTVAFWSELADF